MCKLFELSVLQLQLPTVSIVDNGGAPGSRGPLGLITALIRLRSDNFRRRIVSSCRICHSHKQDQSRTTPLLSVAFCRTIIFAQMHSCRRGNSSFANYIGLGGQGMVLNDAGVRAEKALANSEVALPVHWQSSILYLLSPSGDACMVAELPACLSILLCTGRMMMLCGSVIFIELTT